MGYSGLIYAAIVAAWAAFLVPRWVRRNEEVERAREADTARGVRVLPRGNASMHAPHRGLVADDPAPARVEAEPAAPPDALGEAFAVAARRRRRILALLLAATVAAIVATYVGSAPGWLPVVTGMLTVLFLAAARRAAVAQAQRRRAEARRRRRVRADETAERPADSPEDTGWTVPVADTTRRLVIPDDVEPVADPDAWQPIPVPLPTYVTKPKAPRVARKIDLSKPGSWTSGRLDPIGSVSLPRREPDERPAAASSADHSPQEADEQPEHRRAVGD
ncbi:hypothetical protein [Haloactinopolyspora sp.]|uniref:divisome protein SepX/GlpR n=1 Tax=Haloactinopolyspora sp. TaxID=1966353 RepID=UPI0026212D8C|nr:hypothetical protein [Haloactinopolyspora sp.]